MNAVPPKKKPPRRQCAKCPWRVDVDPNDIPGGYCVKKHRNLKSTIAEPGSFRQPGSMMACHETPPGNELPCVGWLAHQLGPGNNISLRLRVMMQPELGNYVLVGEQHERFEDTLPKKPHRKKRSTS